MQQQKSSRNQEGSNKIAPTNTVVALHQGHQDEAAHSSLLQGPLGYVALTVGIFSVYLVTLAPGVAGGDTGELLSEACHLGTAHPPGYPLFTLLYHVVMRWLPPWPVKDQPFSPESGRHSPAWRANAFSALLSACAASLLASSIALLVPPQAPQQRAQQQQWRRKAAAHTQQQLLPEVRAPPLTLAAAGAAAAYAFAPLTWQYAVTAEVFALNNLFAAALLRAALAHARAPTWRGAAAGALLCGLALTNQHTIVLLAAPLAAWVLAVQAAAARARGEGWGGVAARVAALAACFFAGLLPYAYLPLAARLAHKPGSWGDVTNWRGLLHHMRRADYGSLRLYSGDTTSAPTQAAPGGGIARAAPLAVAAALAAYLVVFHALSNMPLHDPLLFGVHARFWQQPNLLAFALAGAALAYCGGGGGRKARAAAAAAALLLAAAQVWTTTRYVQSCEGFRRDVTLINMSMMPAIAVPATCLLHAPPPLPNIPLLNYPPPPRFPAKRPCSGGFSIHDLVAANIGSSSGSGSSGGGGGVPIFIEGRTNHAEPLLTARYDQLPVGLTHRIVLKEPQRPLRAWLKESRRAWAAAVRHVASAERGGTRERRRRAAWRPPSPTCIAALRVITDLHSCASFYAHSTGGLPPLDKYSWEWWERTLWVIWYDHIAEAGAVLLERAMAMPPEQAPQALEPLLQAAAWLEVAARRDAARDTPAHTLKNLGLAYMHLVRCKAAPPDARRLPRFASDPLDAAALLPWAESSAAAAALDGGSTAAEPWKALAARRFEAAWGAFLQHPEAVNDAQYGVVRAMYDQVTRAAGGAAQQQRSGQ
ncbi:hypothetical protein JKP88DRAFT_240753 [Tribonema minus]|uniref:DUF2723 domain-containing protein n=1 Tax=Tribonema minus TaxID=303371 RepID=A0A835ZER5_9STRA|nr:hypothetical protein JKP88DRAFT_240753 [Tribonema minus]